MANRNGSFYVPNTIAHEAVKVIVKESDRLQSLIRKRVTAATAIVFATARVKRGRIGMTTLKSGNAKTRKMGIFVPVTGRGRKTVKVRMVSDPSAKFGVPVNTGALRASINKEIIGDKYKIRGRVWTVSPIAQFIEFGTWKMQARPFMRPALYENAKEIQKIFTADA